MAVKQSYFCDGCGRSMNLEEVTESNTLAADYARSNEKFHRFIQQIFTEILCGVCLPNSPAYWDEKLDILIDTITVSARRLENHRKSFWSASRAPKAVGASK